jgi:hypothetical protein
MNKKKLKALAKELGYDSKAPRQYTDIKVGRRLNADGKVEDVFQRVLAEGSPRALYQAAKRGGAR